jgi:hypothetical protein
MGIKIFNSLPPYIKDISNDVRKFEICLKKFVHIHSFYSIEEYFQYVSITSFTGHSQHSSKFVICVVLFVICVVLLLIVMFCVLFMCKCLLPPGVNPIAVDKYININNVPLNVFNKTIYLIYSLNSLCLLSLTQKKKS